MKNITLSVDDEIYRRARMIAAERNTSVSSLVRDYLQSLQPPTPARDQELDRIFAILDRSKSKFSASDRLPREQLHDRKRAR